MHEWHGSISIDDIDRPRPRPRPRRPQKKKKQKPEDLFAISAPTGFQHVKTAKVSENADLLMIKLSEDKPVETEILEKVPCSIASRSLSVSGSMA